MSMQKAVDQIVPAVVRPLDENEEISEAAPWMLVNYLINGRVHAHFPHPPRQLFKQFPLSLASRLDLE